ncbi:MAG: AAA family ATPase, partial [Muribaculaceae bacterium]|nr:AAA family ATPase [Muribaculaceae bacterium]
MTPSLLAQSAISELPFTPNQGQLALITALSTFIVSRGPRDVFVLNGYAGTGKTSVMGAIVRAMKRASVKTVILAPTQHPLRGHAPSLLLSCLDWGYFHIL